MVGPLVSVIVPTYDRGPFLRRAVDSIAAQDCVPEYAIEILVVDDGSTDRSIDELEADPPAHQTLRVIRLNHIGEPGTVRNAGLDVATGHYVAYLDSDDFWLPHHVATALQYLRRDPSLGMVSNYWALASFSAGNDGSIRTEIVVPPHDPEAVNTNCRVHKRECLEAVGRFNDELWGEDQDFFGRIEDKFSCVKTGVVTSVNGYIRGGNNLTYQFSDGTRQRFE